MKRLFMNVLLASSMAVGSSAFASNVQAKETAPLIVTVFKADLSDIMDMKVVDQKGKKVNLKDLVAENDVTLLNFWGTFCSSCTEEMPILDKLAKKYEDEGFGIVGICLDIVDTDDNSIIEEKFELGKAVLEDAEVAYPSVFADKKMIEFVNINTYPTSYFVDSEGNIIGQLVLGARLEEYWVPIIEEKLAAVNQ